MLILNWIFFLASVNLCKRKVFANFQQLLILNVPVIIWKWKLCRFFGIELIKIYLIGSNVSIFQNYKNYINLTHPTVLSGGLFLARIGLLHPYSAMLTNYNRGFSHFRKCYVNKKSKPSIFICFLLNWMDFRRNATQKKRKVVRDIYP